MEVISLKAFDKNVLFQMQEAFSGIVRATPAQATFEDDNDLVVEEGVKRKMEEERRREEQQGLIL